MLGAWPCLAQDGTRISRRVRIRLLEHRRVRCVTWNVDVALGR